MAITKTAVTSAGWTQIAADVTAMTYLYVETQKRPTAERVFVEVLAAASEPASEDNGKVLRGGDTVLSDKITELGASGALWARSQKYPTTLYSE